MLDVSIFRGPRPALNLLSIGGAIEEELPGSLFSGLQEVTRTFLVRNVVGGNVAMCPDFPGTKTCPQYLREYCWVSLFSLAIRPVQNIYGNVIGVALVSAPIFKVSKTYSQYLGS